jgi:hypothetical protein
MICWRSKLVGFTLVLLKIASVIQGCGVKINPELSVYYAELGESLVLSVLAYTNQHTWKKEGRPLAFERCNDHDEPNCTKARIYTVGDRLSLRFRKITFADRGTYTVELCSHEYSFRVIVQIKPLVYIDCIDTTVYEGDNITCMCKATNGNPPGTVTWLRTKPEQGHSGMENFTNVLTLRNISRNESGTYTCFAKSRNFVNKTSFNLKVVLKNSIPADKEVRIENFQVLQQFGDADGHSKIFLFCKAEGSPHPSYRISHNGTAVTFGNIHTVDTGKTSSLGQYECLARNRMSSDRRLLLLNESFFVKSCLGKEIRKAQTEWEMVFIVGACSFITGLLVLYVSMCCCRKFKKDGDHYENVEYVDVSARNAQGGLGPASDNVEMRSRHASDSPGNEEVPYDLPVVENTRDHDYYNDNGYQELSEHREKDEERYQSLNPIDS